MRLSIGFRKASCTSKSQVGASAITADTEISTVGQQFSHSGLERATADDDAACAGDRCGRKLGYIASQVIHVKWRPVAGSVPHWLCAFPIEIPSHRVWCSIPPWKLEPGSPPGGLLPLLLSGKTGVSPFAKGLGVLPRDPDYWKRSSPLLK